MINTATSESVTQFQPMDNKNQIKEYRQRANLSQEQLAELVGIDKQEMSMLENGGRKPRVGEMLILCKVLRAKPYSIYPFPF